MSVETLSVEEVGLDAQKQDPPFDIASCLSGAVKRFGKKPVSQAVDMAKLAFGPGKLTAREYYAFRLYDDETYSFVDKQRFLGKRAQDRILLRTVPIDWWSVAHDKLVFHGLLSGLALPVPRIQALYHPFRRFGTTPGLRTAEDLKRYLREEAHYPVFGKPVSGMYSVAVVSATGYDRASDRIVLSGERRVAIEDFAAQLAPYSKDGYLFQDRLLPHEALREISGNHLSTVRVMILVDDDGPRILQSLWKIAVGANIADNFWRAGNLLAALEADSGRILRVVQGTGLDQVELEDHPVSGRRLLGATLPDWPKLTELCLAGAANLPGLTMQAWDVALCPEGPMFVEVNVGGDFNLPQLATGRGILDAELAAFLQRHKRGKAKA